MIRVVILTPCFPPTLNGMATATFQIYKDCIAAGYDVTVFTSTGGSDLSNVRYTACAGSGLPWNPFRGDATEIISFLTKHQPENLIVVGWYTWGEMLIPKIHQYCEKIFLYSHGASDKTILEWSPGQVFRCLFYRVIEPMRFNRTLKYIDKAIVIEQHFDDNRFSDMPYYRKQKVPITVRRNQSSYNNVKNLDDRYSSKKIIVVGTMSLLKNQKALIKTIKICHAFTFVFCFPSWNKYALSFKDDVTRLGLLDNCEFIVGKNSEQLESVFQGASLLLVPSKTEAQSIVMLDALAVGVPVISSDVGCHSVYPSVTISTVCNFSKHIHEITKTLGTYEAAVQRVDDDRAHFFKKVTPMTDILYSSGL